MLSIVMLSIVMLSVIALSVVLLNVGISAQNRMSHHKTFSKVLS
jgi:hypothetical protein